MMSMVNNNYKWLNIIAEYLKKSPDRKLYNNSFIITAVEKRNMGINFTVEEHIKGMVYALLSNQREWKQIEDNLDKIDEIFCNYKPEELKKKPPETLKRELREINCSNRSISAQMRDLNYNIDVLENVDAVEALINAHKDKNEKTYLANRFAHTHKKDDFKLKNIGVALAYEYLRNVGVDAAKPDTHIRRFLKRFYEEEKDKTAMMSPSEASSRILEIKKETGFAFVKIDNIIWSFCAERYGDVCRATPDCINCPIKKMCCYGKNK